VVKLVSGYLDEPMSTVMRSRSRRSWSSECADIGPGFKNGERWDLHHIGTVLIMYKVTLKGKNVIDLSADLIAAHLQES
jgi:hypothetical protein